MASKWMAYLKKNLNLYKTKSECENIILYEGLTNTASTSAAVRWVWQVC